MKLGFILPQIGPIGSPDSLRKAAERAEALGYDSLWVTERLLYPLNPRTPYPATPDGSLPEVYKHSLDPLETLTFVAAHTKRIALGTSVLVMPYYNPVMLARRLTTLDVLSRGRLRVGLGQGSLADEFEAAGATFKDRAARAEEFIQVLKAIWTTDPVEFHGKFFNIAKSIIQPKPVKKPHPPIYLAAFTPNSLKRVARLADGWNPVMASTEQLAQMWEDLKAAAKAEGRDPSSLQLIVRAHPHVTEQPLGKSRPSFNGSLEEIKQDVDACRNLGAQEVFFDPIFSPDGYSLERFLTRMEQLRKLA